MKKMNYIICTLLMLTANLYTQQQRDDQLSELYIPESEFVLKLDADILDMCRKLADE